MPEARVMEATSGFVVGTRVVHKGETVREGHELYVGNERYFRPLVVKYDLPENTSAAPNGRRSRRKEEPEATQTVTLEPAEEETVPPEDEPSTGEPDQEESE